jgi:hypothetical protein
MGKGSGARKFTKEGADNYRSNKFWDSLKDVKQSHEKTVNKKP